MCAFGCLCVFVSARLFWGCAQCLRVFVSVPPAASLYVGDTSFWASHGASFGCEGQNGQAAEMMGMVSYQYHGDGWQTELWGRLITGSSLGFDDDLYCDNPGGMCGWAAIADSFYLKARVYQLALTDELLSSSGSVFRFRGGGVVQEAHARGRVWELSPPSSWPYGGDSIPIVSGTSVLVPLVMPNGQLSSDTLHSYQWSATPGPDSNCPLYGPGYTGADNTCLSNWASPPLASFNLSASLPEMQAVAACNASCWGNSSCGAWDMIKVTPFSGKSKPLCLLFASATGCGSDPNQWAGVKAPLPIPSSNNITWTLPLSWVGHPVSSVTLTPSGPLPSQGVVIQGRQMTLVDITPGWPVRITRG